MSFRNAVAVPAVVGSTRFGTADEGSGRGRQSSRIRKYARLLGAAQNGSIVQFTAAVLFSFTASCKTNRIEPWALIERRNCATDRSISRRFACGRVPHATAAPLADIRL